MREFLYPIGALADRINKRVLLALGYSIGVATALMLALNINSVSSLAIAFILGGAYVGSKKLWKIRLQRNYCPLMSVERVLEQWPWLMAWVTS